MNRYNYNASTWPTSLTQSSYRPNIRFHVAPNASGTQELPQVSPLITALYAAKPNPTAHGIANISFSIASPLQTKLQIYDASGRMIKTLVNAHLIAGIYNQRWNGTDDNNHKVAEGIYFYTLETPQQKFTKKLVFTR